MDASPPETPRPRGRDLWHEFILLRQEAGRRKKEIAALKAGIEAANERDEALLALLKGADVPPPAARGEGEVDGGAR